MATQTVDTPQVGTADIVPLPATSQPNAQRDHPYRHGTTQDVARESLLQLESYRLRFALPATVATLGGGIGTAVEFIGRYPTLGGVGGALSFLLGLVSIRHVGIRGGKRYLLAMASEVQAGHRGSTLNLLALAQPARDRRNIKRFAIKRQKLFEARIDRQQQLLSWAAKPETAPKPSLLGLLIR